jgi:hypothetical protein
VGQNSEPQTVQGMGVVMVCSPLTQPSPTRGEGDNSVIFLCNPQGIVESLWNHIIFLLKEAISIILLKK